MLALGERLVAELKLVDSMNTLARWMAHYIAELIVRAEQAAPAQQREAQEECARAIMDLWALARAFPVERGMFDSVDRIIEVIESLHPDAGPYYRNDRWRALEARASGEGSEIDELLKTALGIDGIARSLIHHVLTLAARVAGRESAEWLEFAQDLEDDAPHTELRVRVVAMGREQESLDRYRIQQLEKQIAQLDQFCAAAQLLRTSLMDSLAEAEAEAEAEASNGFPSDEKDKRRASPARRR